jgi:hypothetical protein
MRVPVITGYQPHDIVGSLTYYFDHQQRVRRIGIEGYTGDESPIVGIASERFGLRSEPRLGAGLYVYRWNAQALSVLHVDFAPIVSSELPQLRRRVMLEVNAPLPGCQLSTEMQTIVNPIGL